MPTIKGEISVGHIATWAGLLVTIIGVGIAIGQDRSDIAMLKAQQVQTIQDSRALIRLQSDMDYLKKAVDELRARP
jgi:hypothetical protein